MVSRCSFDVTQSKRTSPTRRRQLPSSLCRPANQSKQSSAIRSTPSLCSVTLSIMDTKCSSRARHAIGGWRESLFLRQLAVNRLNEENYLRNQIAESNPFGRRRLRKNALMLNAAVMLRSDPLEYLLGITQAASGQVERNANEDISAIRSVRTRSRRLERRDDTAGFGATVQRSRMR